MKKLFAILMATCLMLGMLSMAALIASAEELAAPAAGTVLRVTATKGDETVLIGDYADFIEGWNVAITQAKPRALNKNGYDRIVIDFFADWTATNGSFTNDAVYEVNDTGFNNDTLQISADAKVTVNLNGHTIDRALGSCTSNGEVLCVASGADLIVNKGTIKGGFSGNGAGGIHIKSKATVTLNDVHVSGNTVEDDDGAAIAVLGGATLFMNGGSISGNLLRRTYSDFVGVYPYGSLYVENSTAILDKVTISDNATTMKYAKGVAIYATGSTVTMKDCVVSDNATGEGEKRDYADSIIAAYDSHLMIHNTEFSGNANKGREDDLTRLFYMDDSTLIMEGGKITGNTTNELFYMEDTDAKFKGVTMFDNNAKVLYVDNGNEQVDMNTCTIYHNETAAGNVFVKTKGTLTMTDCTLNDTTFANPENVNFVQNSVAKEDAVMGVTVLLADGTSIFTKYYKSFEDGWNDAMTNTQLSNGYDRVIVDLYADWNTRPDLDTAGFTVTVPEKARVTLNMNGHTIERNLYIDSSRYAGRDGEAMYVSANADLIINDGTIRGGRSTTGAGGIHIKDNAKVVLNNVNVLHNATEYSNGTAIAVYNGAVLVMNGGSIDDSYMRAGELILIFITPHGAVHVEDATAILNQVTLTNNRSDDSDSEGVAVHAQNSTVMLNECIVSNNGKVAESVIAAYDSKLTITNTEFTGNNENDKLSYLIYLKNSELTMEGGKITDNKAGTLFHMENTQADIKDVTITDNASKVIYVDNSGKKVTMTNCTMGNNAPTDNKAEVQVVNQNTLVMNDCSLGDTTFENKSLVGGVGSMVGEGSLTTIAAILALVVACVSISLTLTYIKKKKNAPAAMN